jgi:alpha-glucuronidase
VEPCWWPGKAIRDPARLSAYRNWVGPVRGWGAAPLVRTAVAETAAALRALLGPEGARGTVRIGTRDAVPIGDPVAGRLQRLEIPPEGYAWIVEPEAHRTTIVGADEQGALYGAMAFVRQLALGLDDPGTPVVDGPRYPFRMLNHWDNVDGSVERGYAGRSIFFADGTVRAAEADRDRWRAYARLLASVGINAVAVNNVNVRGRARELLRPPLLDGLSALAATLRAYGVRLWLAVDFESPRHLGGTATADPRDPAVRRFWQDAARRVYAAIPDLGGFLVKADSEFRPGPSAYGRTQADGANCLAAALEPWGGQVFWRTFAYPMQDWRDRRQDRARAAYDLFQPLDGRFLDNVVLQTKIGPMDFQVREPVSPLLGGLEKTRQVMEVQITQEYTGQQRDLFYWGGVWQEALATEIRGDVLLRDVLADPSLGGGLVGVANIGDDPNWTGHDLAQANWYAFGRLAWDPTADARRLAREWATLTFGPDPVVVDTVTTMLVESAAIYEQYTTPFGTGWMVTPGHHYGPSPDGYEYSHWGTYHRADHTGIGIDRTVATGTGFVGQYREPLKSRYERRETCPEPLLLFFHRLAYTERLANGETLLQNLYDAHFAGVEGVERLQALWESLAGRVPPAVHARVAERLVQQRANAENWRDVVNTYFYRKSGIPDGRGRRIEP